MSGALRSIVVRPEIIWMREVAAGIHADVSQNDLE